MLKPVVFLVLGALLGSPLHTQTPPAQASSAAQPQAATAAETPAPAPAMCREATDLDELIKALDEAVSGPADKDRSCMRELLLPEAP
jgi:predicted lipid-binding transport protein (Tim44 family)